MTGNGSRKLDKISIVIQLAGKLSRRAVTTGREGYDCANSGDSWLHVDVITNTNGEIKW